MAWMGGFDSDTDSAKVRSGKVRRGKRVDFPVTDNSTRAKRIRRALIG
jgi:hypothetical protein